MSKPMIMKDEIKQVEPQCLWCYRKSNKDSSGRLRDSKNDGCGR